MGLQSTTTPWAVGPLGDGLRPSGPVIWQGDLRSYFQLCFRADNPKGDGFLYTTISGFKIWGLKTHIAPAIPGTYSYSYAYLRYRGVAA